MIFKHINNWAKKSKPWGFRNLSIYDVSMLFWKGISEGSVTTRASSLAFNFFLAFFPAIIFIFTLIPYIPIEGFQETLIEILSSILPPSTHEIATKTIEDIVNNRRGGLLSIGFILALYFSTNGIYSLIEAFNSSYHVKESRTIIYQRYIALILTLILAAMIITTISLIIFSKSYLNFLIINQTIESSNLYIFTIMKWSLLSVCLFIGISTIFHVAPNLETKWRLFSPGTIFSTLFIIITSILFSMYINNFAQYNQIYGSIRALIIILLWIYFNSIILLTGFELNASILNASKKL